VQEQPLPKLSLCFNFRWLDFLICLTVWTAINWVNISPPSFPVLSVLRPAMGIIKQNHSVISEVFPNCCFLLINILWYFFLESCQPVLSNFFCTVVYYTGNTIIGTDIPSFTCTTCFSLKGHHQVQEVSQFPFSFHLLCVPKLASVYTLGVCWMDVLSLYCIAILYSFINSIHLTLYN
jgi:hypothetical protein